MPIDPDAQRVLDLIRETGRPPYETLPHAEARRLYAAGRGVLQPEPQEVAEVRDLACPGPGGAIRLRAYRGVGAPETAPCLVFYHGGGWVVGDLDTHDGPCRALANAARCRVVAVDYRLAPEHKFPAAFEDAAAALRFVAAEAARLGVDRARIAVGGDSAGGNLAAAVALAAREDGGATPMPAFQLLIYPALDLAMTAASYQRVTEGVPLTARTARWFRDHYLAEPRQALDWRASPLRAPSLAGLPPAFVLTAGIDPLCDEGLAYVRRLDEDGVRVAHLHLADQIHGALTMGRFIRAAELIVRVSAEALRDAWSRA
ncbi:alpha/beta hydrolase [Caldovatus aquaticus]|uniref:Alpha/beta hydrolase n=1 Tax=Caldovatus aquaticus TaxID=2865671 RepID=A0ABS7EY13_9PROT|nr:alpha/beta hydrolase [Caldovatus aquaticus]MBW8268003.1 alpha/beta hydrolase [Caldovatus aquaticus]